MIENINSFIGIWQQETELTRKIFAALTTESLIFTPPPYKRSIGKIANHITETVYELPHTAGLPINYNWEDKHTVKEIEQAYQHACKLFEQELQKNWTNEMLSQTIPMYGEQWTRATALNVLLLHQTHHRGQLTVLMRLAGIIPPSLYGPTYEDWITYNQIPHP